MPQSILLNMMHVYLPLFMSIQFIAIGCLFFYRITRQQHEANLAALAKRAAEAEALSAQAGSSSAP